MPSKLFLALFNVMTKTISTTSFAFWPGLFMDTTDFSSQAFRSVLS